MFIASGIGGSPGSVRMVGSPIEGLEPLHAGIIMVLPFLSPNGGKPD